MKSRFQAKNSGAPNSFVCTVTAQDDGESSLTCKPIKNEPQGQRLNVEKQIEEQDAGERLTQIVQDFQSSGRIPVFAPHPRHLATAAATITPPVPGIRDNFLQYEMTTRDGFTIFLREWLKPDDGSSPFSRKHPNTTRSVLFLPGFPHAAMLVWKFQVNDPALAKKYRMITMEVRGHGDSSKPTSPSDFTQQKWADDIQDAITLLQLYKPALIGHSHGGLIVTRYLNIYGDSALAGLGFVAAFTKLDLTDPTIGPTVLDPKVLAIFPSLLNLNNDLGDFYRGAHEFADLSFWSPPPPSDRYRENVLATDMLMPPATRQAMLLPPNAVTNTSLSAVTKPALVVHAKDNCGVNRPKCTKSRDDLILVQHAIDNYNKLKQNSTKATLKLMDGVGHFPQAEDCGTFNAILLDFLKSL